MKRRETIKLTVQWNPEKRNPKNGNPQKDYSDEENWGTQKTRIPKKGNHARKGITTEEITQEKELGDGKHAKKEITRKGIPGMIIPRKKIPRTGILQKRTLKMKSRKTEFREWQSRWKKILEKGNFDKEKPEKMSRKVARGEPRKGDTREKGDIGRNGPE